MLDQTELLELDEGVPAVPPLGAYRTFQVPIADIGALAGVEFGPLVRPTSSETTPPSRGQNGSNSTMPTASVCRAVPGLSIEGVSSMTLIELDGLPVYRAAPRATRAAGSS